MTVQALSSEDQVLIDAATSVIQRNFTLGKHHVGAAVRTGSGKIYAGVHLESPGADICAEAVAIGLAASAGEREFETIVAVTAKGSAPRILPPCGTCRELVMYYGGDRIAVIVADGARLGKVRGKALLPVTFRRTDS